MCIYIVVVVETLQSESDLRCDHLNSKNSCKLPAGSSHSQFAGQLDRNCITPDLPRPKIV